MLVLIEVPAVLAAQDPPRAHVPFVSEGRHPFRCSRVVILSGHLPLIFPFSLNLPVSNLQVNSFPFHVLISPRKCTNIFNFVHSPFFPTLESSIIRCPWPKKLHWTLRCRWREFKFIFNNQLAFFILKLFFQKKKNLIMHKKNSLRINSLGIKLKKGKDVNNLF